MRSQRKWRLARSCGRPAIFVLAIAIMVLIANKAINERISAASGSTRVIASQVAPHAVLKADYQFQGNLNSSVGTAPALTNLVGAGNGPNTFSTDQVDGFSRQVLNFPSNSGFAINSLSGVVTETSFTAVILFKMDALSGRRRLLDTSGGTQADQGVFLVDGRIEGENLSSVPSTAATYFQIVFVRGGGTLKAYREGFLRVVDPDDGSPLPNGVRFFQDYVNSPVQASSGSIARLRFYEGTMTDDEVASLDRVPETVSGTMPLLFNSNRFGYANRLRMNPDGTSQQRLTSGSVTEVRGRFSPNGQKTVYQSQPNANTPPSIWISNSDGSNPVQLTATGINDQFPSWRPDGQKIIFSRCAPPVCDIYTMDPDGTNVQPLTAANTANSEEFPRYTPDGTKIVFACSLAGNNLQLCTANADGTNRIQITNEGAPIQHTNPDISPDGTKIACIRGTGPDNNRITVMNIDGTGATTLPQINNVTTPIWSPDGTKLAYARVNTGNSREVLISNADGSGETRLTFNSSNEGVSDWYRPQQRSTMFDFDGDAKADMSIFKPTDGTWWRLNSSTNNATYNVLQMGVGTDQIVPADYTGDGKADVAVWRPSTAEWFVLRSEDNSYYGLQWGATGDIPVPGDFDGDGKADVAVFRPSQGLWYILQSTAGVRIDSFGNASDKPVVGDYDGDGKADVAIFRPSTGDWWVARSTAGLIAIHFGGPGDRVTPADFTGDGKTDLAVFRPSTSVWYVLRSEDTTFYGFQFGTSTDIPAPADYDGDGKADVAIFRPAAGQWWVAASTAGVSSVGWGSPGDTPVPSAYVR